MHIGRDGRKHFSFCIGQRISFFCDGKTCNLQTVPAKNLLHAGKFYGILCIKQNGFRNAADNGFGNRAVCLQCNEDAVIVMGTVHFADDFVVKTFGYNQTTIQNTFIQQILNDICLEGTEDIAGSKVNPEGIFSGLFTHGCMIKGGELIAFFFPYFTIL